MANYLQLSELIYKLNKVNIYISNENFRCKYFEYMFKSVRKKKIQHSKEIMACSVYSFEEEVSEYSNDARKIYMYCEEWAF